MSIQKPMIEELLSRHELAFSIRFTSLLNQLADEDYFELLKVKEVEFETEERGVQGRNREIMMILNCKVRATNYLIYHDLNNRVERRLRISAYIFDEEGCVYLDKSARKTPLNLTKLRSMFVLNPAITKPSSPSNHYS